MFCIIRPDGRVAVAFRFEYEALRVMRVMPGCRLEFRFV